MNQPMSTRSRRSGSARKYKGQGLRKEIRGGGEPLRTPEAFGEDCDRGGIRCAIVAQRKPGLLTRWFAAICRKLFCWNF